MAGIPIRYSFTLPDASREVFDLELNAVTFTLEREMGSIQPWTALAFHRCPNCPLSIDTHSHCPVATNIANMVQRFDHLLSFDKVQVEVTTQERKISQNTTAQRGISSLMGLLIATSACPLTDFFKPMARFHLPFASEEETICRAASMYLLAQYFSKRDGHDTIPDLKGLTRIYHDIHVVNQSMAARLRAASDTDSTTNAIIILDMFAKAVPDVIEESLSEIRYLFEPFLGKMS